MKKIMKTKKCEYSLLHVFFNIRQEWVKRISKNPDKTISRDYEEEDEEEEVVEPETAEDHGQPEFVFF